MDSALKAARASGSPDLSIGPLNYLRLSNPTKFKKKGKKKPQVSDVEWPCKMVAESPSLTALGWPTLKLPSAPATRLPSMEEQARIASTRVQQKALMAAQEFYADSDGEEDSGGDEDDDFMDEDAYKEYNFLLNVFKEDGEFRGYYEKNCEGGDFCCLVCGGIGEKVGKRFKDCVALVQHSITIAKTKKKRAHRAYAQVICKVLGWDIDKLPNVSSLAKSADFQGNAEVGLQDLTHLSVLNQNVFAKNSNIGQLILKEVSDLGQKKVLLRSDEPTLLSVVGANVMLCESSLEILDASKPIGNLDNGDSSMVSGKTQRVVNRLCKNLERTMVLERN